MRRLRAHLDGLGRWTQADELAATVVDRLARIDAILLTALGGTPGDPPLFPRPNDPGPAAPAAGGPDVIPAAAFAQRMKELTRG